MLDGAIFAGEAVEAGAAIAESSAAAEGAAAASESVQIFRNVDASEFNSIATSGEFGVGEGTMEGKWFATSGEHADQWGAWLNGGEGTTVETQIPRSVANQLHCHKGNLDGIGPAWYANESDLNAINESMNGIRVWP